MRRQLLFFTLSGSIALAACETMEKAGENVTSSFASIKESLLRPFSATPKNGEERKVNRPNGVITTAIPKIGTEHVIVGTVSSRAVIDGDTIVLNNKRIRLYGIDAPERLQQCTVNRVSIACGVMARNVLLGFAIGTMIRCVRKDIDRYGRDVSRCFANNFDLSAGMVRSGFAVAYRQYSQAYVSEEAEAKRLKRGMWRGSFDMPWDWRAQRRRSSLPPNTYSL